MYTRLINKCNYKKASESDGSCHLFCTHTPRSLFGFFFLLLSPPIRDKSFILAALLCMYRNYFFLTQLYDYHYFKFRTVSQDLLKFTYILQYTFGFCDNVSIPFFHSSIFPSAISGFAAWSITNFNLESNKTLSETEAHRTLMQCCKIVTD